MESVLRCSGLYRNDSKEIIFEDVPFDNFSSDPTLTRFSEELE